MAKPPESESIRQASRKITVALLHFLCTLLSVALAAQRYTECSYAVAAVFTMCSAIQVGSYLWMRRRRHVSDTHITGTLWLWPCSSQLAT